jgi:hypothetical protein
MSITGLDRKSDRSFAIEAEPDKLTTLKIFVRQPRGSVAAQTQPFRFVVEDRSNGESDRYEATFEAPEVRR